jgi:hypothetical protein
MVKEKAAASVAERPLIAPPLVMVVRCPPYPRMTDVWRGTVVTVPAPMTPAPEKPLEEVSDKDVLDAPGKLGEELPAEPASVLPSP